MEETVYQRPDGSTYALDRYGRQGELQGPGRGPGYGTRILGPAKFAPGR